MNGGTSKIVRTLVLNRGHPKIKFRCWLKTFSEIHKSEVQKVKKIKDNFQKLKEYSGWYLCSQTLEMIFFFWKAKGKKKNKNQKRGKEVINNQCIHVTVFPDCPASGRALAPGLEAGVWASSLSDIRPVLNLGLSQSDAPPLALKVEERHNVQGHSEILWGLLRSPESSGAKWPETLQFRGGSEKVSAAMSLARPWAMASWSQLCLAFHSSCFFSNPVPLSSRSGQYVPFALC